MDELAKLRILLPHWLEHNGSHGQEFARWAALFEESRPEIAALLHRAASSLREADNALREALRQSGGEVPSHAPHHHHHNLPE